MFSSLAVPVYGFTHCTLLWPTLRFLFSFSHLISMSLSPFDIVFKLEMVLCELDEACSPRPKPPQDRQALTKTDRQKDRRARKREQREAVGGRGSKCGQSSVRTKYSRASRRDLKVLHSVERERGRERVGK